LKCHAVGQSPPNIFAVAMTPLAIIAFVLCGVGTLITCINVYLSFIQYPIHRWRGGTRENFRWISGFPIFGSLFLWIGAVLLLLAGEPTWMCSAALVISLFDTGGLHWFVGTMLLG
jgi:hypothetical protein